MMAQCAAHRPYAHSISSGADIPASDFQLSRITPPFSLYMGLYGARCSGAGELRTEELCLFNGVEDLRHTPVSLSLVGEVGA